MAASPPVALFGPVKEEDAANYNRVMELVVVCGTKTLQKYLEKCLKNNGKTLEAHVSDNDIIPNETMFLSPEQIAILKKPSFELCDSSLCRILFKYLNPRCPDNVHRAMDRLRNIRNTLAHQVKCEVKGSDLFKEGEKYILKVASAVGRDFRDAIAGKIKEIKGQTIVRITTTADRLKLAGELLMCKLDDADHGMPFENSLSSYKHKVPFVLPASYVVYIFLNRFL